MICVVTNMVKNTRIMARFIRINVGVEEKIPYFFNLDSIEGVDLKNKRVYTIGSSESYHIAEQESWDRILRFVEKNLQDGF